MKTRIFALVVLAGLASSHGTAATAVTTATAVTAATPGPLTQTPVLLAAARAPLAAVLATGVTGSKLPEVDLKVQISVPEPATAAGSQGEAVVTLTAPPGIHINQYPPIRLTLEPSPPLSFPSSTIKVGLDAMPDDPEKNPFEKIDPIRVKFMVGEHALDGKVPVKGKLKFFYCVARSGYCAPGSKDVAFNVPVTSKR